MRSTFHGLEVAKRGLFAQQTAINTTGHNIANVNTRGYTRQVVDTTASLAIDYPGSYRSAYPGQLGTGVEVTEIRRIREGFLDQQYWNESQRKGEYDMRANTLEKLEGIFNEPADEGSLSKMINEFWGSFNELASNPDSSAARRTVVDSIKNLSETFNLKGRQLADLSTDLTKSINLKVTQADSFTNQIAKLNEQIVNVEALGDNANDLRDRRDVLVDDLSKLVNITVAEQANGSYTIKMGVQDLVNGALATLIVAESPPGTKNINITSGEINGLFLSRDKVADQIVELNAMIDTLVQGDIKITMPAGSKLASAAVGTDGPPPTPYAAGATLGSDTELLVKGINGLHALGWNLKDPSGAGLPLFQTNDASATFTALNVEVGAGIQADENALAASNREGIDGNREMALILYNLKDQKFSFNRTLSSGATTTTATLDGFYGAMTSSLGIEANRAYNERDNLAFIVENLENSRMSVSGVSLDEEMANLVKFQHAYNAAARQITVMDEMLDKIINGMGVVGR